jgi:hypothetical protein
MTSQRMDSSARDRRSVASVLRRLRVLLVAAALLIAGSPPAMATYWNVFNVEGESTLSAQIVTYASLADMLGDVNRTGVFTPNPLGFGVNIVGGDSDGSAYWNVFNIEGESAFSAQIVTYASLADMLGDVNRTGVFTPNPLGFGVNIVGSGSDGTTYWNVFNIEGESAFSAQIVTYASLADMLADTNRTGVFTPNPLGFGVNIVESGSDGSAYWNAFNIEGESAFSAQIVTYASLADMLGDVNRTGVFTPNPLGFGVNIVGSGADILVAPPPPGAIPEPATIGLLGSALLTLALARRRRVIGVERSG